MPKSRFVQREQQSPKGSSIATHQRELAMPKYQYQTPRTGTFVTRYDETEERKRRSETPPALHNFRFS